MTSKLSAFALSRAGAVFGATLLLSGQTLAGMHGFAVTLAESGLLRPSAPHYTQRPGPVFRGTNPGRDPGRSAWWTPAKLRDRAAARLNRAVEAAFERGELFLSLEGGLTLLQGGTNPGGGDPLPGEGGGSGGGSGTIGPKGTGTLGGQTNTNTGNKLSDLPLVAWSSRGDSGVDFALFHNSVVEDDGPFGYGWSHSYSTRIDYAGTTATVVMPDGTEAPFSEASGVFSRPPGFFAGLVHETDGTWTLEMKGGTVMRFDSGGLLTSVTDRYGNATSLGRDTSQNLTTITSVDGRQLTLTYTSGRVSKVTDPAGREWTFAYTSGNLTGVGYPYATGFPATTRGFTYNGTHDILTETDRQGKVWTWAYNGTGGQMASWTDPTARTTSYSYGTSATTITLPGTGRTIVHNYSSGLLASLVDEGSFSDARTYDSDRNLTGFTDSRGKAWVQTFDGAGSRKTLKNPLLKTWTFTYNALNDLDTETDPLGHTTTYAYTGRKLDKVTDALGHDTVRFTYNSYGDVLTSKDALNRTTTLTYNTQGDVDSVTDPAGVTTTSHYDVLGRVDWTKDAGLNQTSLAYDPLGRVTTVTNPGGSGQSFTYDKEGSPLSRTDEIGRTTLASHDNAGRLLTETDGNGDVQTTAYTSAGFVRQITDGNGHVRTFTRTVRGEAASLTLADGSVEQWSYDGAGNVTQRIDPLNRTTGMAYDDAGQMTGINRPVSYDPTFSYDDAGRQTGMTDASGTTTWTYDDANRLTTLIQPNGKQVYGYNDADQRTSMAEYAGTTTLLGTTTYALNATNGRLTGLTNRFSQTTGYTYDSQGRLSVRTLPNGNTETTTYDARSQTDLITLKNSGGTTLQAHDYGYDNASQVTSHKIGSVTTSYGYDGAGQLTSESRTGYSATYNYDDNYNRTSRTVGGTTHTYAYDNGDKLQTVKIGSTTIRSYTYDAAGQPTAVTESAGTTNLIWDDDARMTSLTPPGSSAQTNAYNALGTRVAAGTKSFVRDGVGVTAPVLRDGLADYTPGISERRSGTDRYLSSDLKNTDVQTAAAGGASAKRTYDAFGKVVASTGTWNGPSGYGGAVGYQEDGNGLTLLGNRWYDAEVGRFLTRDPAKDGRNWYAYCGNDPIGNADPDGLKIKVVGTPEEQERLRKIIHDFGRSRTGRQIVYDLTRYASTIEVEAANTIGDAGAHMIGNYPNRYMKVWSPLYGDILPNDGQDHQPLISPAKVMMAHELGHAYGFIDPSYGDVPSPGDVIGRVENPYRKELGIPLRHYYVSKG